MRDESISKRRRIADGRAINKIMNNVWIMFEEVTFV
jgi:hypothetical protein